MHTQAKKNFKYLCFYNKLPPRLKNLSYFSLKTKINTLNKNKLCKYTDFFVGLLANTSTNTYCIVHVYNIKFYISFNTYFHQIKRMAWKFCKFHIISFLWHFKSRDFWYETSHFYQFITKNICECFWKNILYSKLTFIPICLFFMW